MKTGTIYVLPFLILKRLGKDEPLLYFLIFFLIWWYPEKIEDSSYNLRKNENSFLRSVLSMKELHCLLRTTDLLKIKWRSSTWSSSVFEKTSLSLPMIVHRVAPLIGKIRQTRMIVSTISLMIIRVDHIFPTLSLAGLSK
jgi:hypothetical protein